MTLRRWAVAPGLLLVGALTAAAAVLSHELWWGLPLVGAALLACYVAVGPGWSTRLPLAGGFAGVVVASLGTRPEGDHLVSSSSRGYLLLLLTLVLVVASLVTLPRPRRVPGPGAPGATTYHGARD